MGAICFLPIISLLIIGSSAAFSSNKYTKMLVSIDQWAAVDTVTGKRSIFDCASACSLTHYCSAFHYDGATQACQLGSKETIMAAASSGASKIPVYYNQDYISNGYVIFAIDANTSPALWLYSADGNCQHQIGLLDPLVGKLNNVVMALWGNKILACDGTLQLRCSLYDVHSNNWTFFAKFSTGQATQPVIHQGKIFFLDETTPKVVDLATKKLSTWALAPTNSSVGCYVSWHNYILKFGLWDHDDYWSYYDYWGYDEYWSDVSLYNPSNNSWTLLPGKVPLYIEDTFCTALPNNNILVVGVRTSGNKRAYFEFNVTSNSWSIPIYGQQDNFPLVPLVLGQRVFVVPINGKVAVEEYIISKSTITYGAKNIQFVASKPSAVAVPSDWFSNLKQSCKGVK